MVGDAIEHEQGTRRGGPVGNFRRRDLGRIRPFRDRHDAAVMHGAGDFPQFLGRHLAVDAPRLRQQLAEITRAPAGDRIEEQPAHTLRPAGEHRRHRLPAAHGDLTRPSHARAP